MNPNIYISLFRVSSDGQFLDVIVDCPRGYQFTGFTLQANYRVNKVDSEDVFNIGDSIFRELVEILEDGTFKYELSLRNHWVIRIPIEQQLGISVPAIFTGTFSAQKIQDTEASIIEEEGADDWDPEHTGEEDAVHHIMHEIPGPDVLPDATAICSDVSNVYNNILDGVINTTGACDTVSDDVIRIYLILYAHQEALRLGHFADAVLYFNMINDNFNICGHFARSGSGPSCGCGRSTSIKSSSASKPGGASCGCGGR